MTIGWKKGIILRYVMMHNIIRANHETEFFVCCWQRALAMFEVQSHICQSTGHHFKQSVDMLI